MSTETVDALLDEKIERMVERAVTRRLAGLAIPSRPKTPEVYRLESGNGLEVAAAKSGLCAATIRRIESGHFSRVPTRNIWRIADACSMDRTMYHELVTIQHEHYWRRRNGAAG